MKRLQMDKFTDEELAIMLNMAIRYNWQALEDEIMDELRRIGEIA